MTQQIFDCLSANKALNVALLSKFHADAITQADLAGHPFVNDRWLGFLGKQGSLTTADLSRCQDVSDSGVKLLSGAAGLYAIRLDGCIKLTDRALAPMAGKRQKSPGWVWSGCISLLAVLYFPAPARHRVGLL